MTDASQYKKTAWMSADEFYQGWVAGVNGKTWSFEIVEVHDYGDVPVAEGSGYETEQEAFNAMSAVIGGEELIPSNIVRVRRR